MSRATQTSPAETGFYATGTRYYDPEICRFINADDESLVTATPNALTDKNLFAYCDNNPVVRADNDGEFWHIVAGAVIGGVSSFISSMATGSSIGDSLISAGFGALQGGLSAALPGASAIIGAGIGALESVTLDIKNNKSVSETITNAAISAGFGAITGSQISKKSSSINKAVKAIKKTTAGNHPVVKKAAKKLVRSAIRQIGRDSYTSIFESTAYGYLSWGTKSFANCYIRRLRR